MDAQQAYDDFVVLGDIDVFQSKDGKVISIEDQEYLKPCGEPVMTQVGEDGSDATYCVKIVEHPSGTHEDKHGNTRPDFSKLFWQPYGKVRVLEDDYGVRGVNATPAFNIHYPEHTNKDDLYAGILLGVVLSFVLVALGIILGSVL